MSYTFSVFKISHGYTFGFSQDIFNEPFYWLIKVCDRHITGILHLDSRYIKWYIKVYAGILLGQPVAGLKRGLGGAVHGSCWKMKKGCWKIKMWGKCGVRNHKIGVWAWCLIILFVVLKTPFCGAKG